MTLQYLRRYNCSVSDTEQIIMPNPKIEKILNSQPYSVKEGVFFMIAETGPGFRGESSDILINKLKVFFKKWPAVFDILHGIVGASRVGLSAKEAIKDLGEDKVILNLGSGTKVKRKDVINVDFYPFRNVDVVADVARLPFKDDSVDAVICESLLEHLRNPWLALKEIRRVLRPEGLIYITVPFMAGFHSSPDDYYRWSREGLRILMEREEFKEMKLGIRHGPTSGVLSVVNDWLGTVFSFNSSRLQQVLLMILTIATSPLKLLDHLISKLKTSSNTAFGFYYLGRKV